MMTLVLPIILLLPFFAGPGVPALVRYAPELCGIAASVYVVLYVVRNGFAQVRFAYWVLILLFALHILFGIIANQVQPGTVIVGGRMYFRTIPFFLLAIALTPSETDLRRQFLILLGVACMQLPIAIYQKVSNYRRALTEGYVTTTGDWVTGTLEQSHFLSLFLICFSAVVVALYARKILSLGKTIVVLLIVLAPTMINETKVTFFLAPLAIGIPIIAISKGNRFKNSIKAFAIVIGFLSIFVPVYDHFVMPRWGYGLVDFITMEGRLEGYLDKGTEVGTTEKAGRIDSIRIAIDVLRKDPAAIVFGFGIGAVTESNFGPQYEGAKYSVYGSFSGPTYARLLWEIGFLGTALVLFVLYLVFRDARVSNRRNDTYGTLATSYLAVVPIMVIAMMYKDLLLSPAISACFWYYCGVVAAVSNQPPTVATVHSDGFSKKNGARTTSAPNNSGRTTPNSNRSRSSRNSTSSSG